MGVYLNPGNSGFVEILQSYYVDKTGLISLLNSTIGTKKKLTCISRPRRFGKSYAAQIENGDFNMFKSFFNSFVISTCAMLIAVVLAVPASYSIARYKFVGRKAMLLGFLVTQMLPVSVLLTPMFIMFRNMKVYNTWLAPILADATIGIPFSVLILKNYFASIPKALEEAVVNSLYHRDWTIREPVEITVEPERISILSFSGPNHTIPMEAVQKGISLRSRRYRNRRLGEFLKELDLTEGRATGIPTIQDELQANGSPAAKIETDEERTYFLIDIPCHPYFVNKEITTDSDVVTDGNVTKDGVKGGVKGGVKELTEIQEVIVKEMLFDPYITTGELAQKTSIKFRTLQRYVSQLQAAGIIIREGGRKEGKWVIINKE